MREHENLEQKRAHCSGCVSCSDGKAYKCMYFIYNCNQKVYTMLENLFTSGTRVKILGLLMFHPDEEYHLRGIARLIQTSPIYVSKELAKLEKINLVVSTRKANLHLYSLNRDCVFLHDYCHLYILNYLYFL